MFASVHTSALTISRVQAEGRLARLAIRIRDALALRRQRVALLSLDDRALADIGLDRDLAAAEAARPLWDVPAHWTSRAL